MKFLGVLATIIILAGCTAITDFDNDVRQEITDINDNEVTKDVAVISIENENSSINTDNNFENEDLFGHFLTRNPNEVLLIDVATGATVNSYRFEASDFVYKFFDLEGDYFAALVGIENPTLMGIRERITFEEVLEMGEVSDELQIYLFDRELEPINSFPISDEHLKDALHWHTHHLVLQDGQLFVYYSPFLWQTGESTSSICRYHVQTGETEILLSTSLTGINNVLVLENDDVMVTNYHLISDTQGEEIYGIVNLTTGTESFNRKENYRIDTLTRFKNKILMNMTAPFSVDEENTEDSEIILFDLMTKNSRSIKIGFEGNMWVTQSLDGNYIVTVTDDFSHFRKYDVQEGNLVHEVTLENIEDISLVEIFPLTNTQYAVHLITTDATGGIVPWQMMGYLERDVRIITTGEQ